MGFEYLRFDYSGHGCSDGNIEEQLISSWIKETKYFIRNKLNFPTIIVGSSLGGWISLLLSKSLNKKIKGIIGIGAAPDFTNDLIQKLTKKNLLNTKKKYLSIASDYDEENYIFNKNFIEDSKKYFVLKKLSVLILSLICFMVAGYCRNSRKTN